MRGSSFHQSAVAWPFFSVLRVHVRCRDSLGSDGVGVWRAGQWWGEGASNPMHPPRVRGQGSTTKQTQVTEDSENGQHRYKIYHSTGLSITPPQHRDVAPRPRKVTSRNASVPVGRLVVPMRPPACHLPAQGGRSASNCLRAKTTIHDLSNSYQYGSCFVCA